MFKYLSLLVGANPRKLTTRDLMLEKLSGRLNSWVKICWVKWKTVCQPKSKGGLGVKDVRAVNLSPLAKWRRWLLQMIVPFGKRFWSVSIEI